MEAGVAQDDRLSFKRRFYMKDGSVRFNPGQRNSNIVRSTGPIDPQVGIVNLTNVGDKKTIGTILSFALYLDTVGGTEYSACYPKHFEDHLWHTFGPTFVSLFGAGACCDINHVDVTVRS